MSHFKKFLLERDVNLYSDLVGFDPQEKSYSSEEKPEKHDDKSVEKKPEKKGFSRRGFLGGAAAALGLGALGGISSMRRDTKKSKPIAPQFRDDETEEEFPPHYYDDHEEENKPDSGTSSGSVSRPSSRPDPEAYLKSLGPIRRMGAKNDPDSYYHQIGGKKQGLFSRLFGRRKK